MDTYKRLYAFLVGQVDDTIQSICENLMAGRYGFHELNAVGEKLRDALMVAEDMYLDAEEADETEDTEEEA